MTSSHLCLPIPEELQKVPQWVTWKLERRDKGKTAKVPHSARTGERASVVDPNAWTSYDEAIECAEKFGFNGIGFVITATDPYFGIDLDDCRDAATGELKPWARPIIDALGSYAEVSQSGTGVHVIGRGQLPAGSRKAPYEDGSIEMYDSARFFVMTGDHLPGTPLTVETRDAEVRALYEKLFGTKPTEEPAKTQVGVCAKKLRFVPAESPGLDDEEVLRRARAAENGEKFQRLFDHGDSTNYDDDQSRADLALCKLFSYWTTNPEQIDRLFQRSALMRGKWKDHPSYSTRTIKKALTDMEGQDTDMRMDTGDVGGIKEAVRPSEVSEPVRSTLLLPGPCTTLKVVSGTEIYNKHFDPLKWYVKPILHEGATLLSGDPKVGKSFLALQLGLAVAGTQDVALGSLPVGTHGPVLYLALDDGSERRIHDRLFQLGAGTTAVENLSFVTDRKLLPTLSAGFEELLRGTMKGKNYELIILDTLGVVLEGGSPRKGVYKHEYEQVIKLQQVAQEHGSGLLLVHHTNKGDGKNAVTKASGSHGLTGAVDSVLLLTADELIARPRDAEESQHTLIRSRQDGSWAVADRSGPQLVKKSPKRETLTPQSQQVKDLLATGPKSKEEIAAQLGIKPDAARKRLARMEDKQLIKRRGDGTYEWAA